jgi:hypothetical protein
VGEDVADRYFDYAMGLDGSPEMRAQVTALKAGQ